MPKSVSSSAIFLIRLLVGWVFVVEGILKFMRPEEFGYGRFLAIGIPGAHFIATLVGLIEIVCGALVIMGWFTTIAVIPLLCVISVAIISTKLPLLLGHPVWHFAPASNIKQYGLLTMLHEARTDISMLLGLLYLLITGPGIASVDTGVRRKKIVNPGSADSPPNTADRSRN